MIRKKDIDEGILFNNNIDEKILREYEIHNLTIKWQQYFQNANDLVKENRLADAYLKMLDCIFLLKKAMLHMNEDQKNNYINKYRIKTVINFTNNLKRNKQDERH